MKKNIYAKEMNTLKFHFNSAIFIWNVRTTPSIPKYKEFWLDVTYPSTMNLDRIYI